MKKKNVIIPAILVAITLLLIPFITLFTTNVLYEMALDETSFQGYDKGYIALFSETYKSVEIAAKLSPNISTLWARNRMFGDRPGDTAVRELEKVCPDYKEKAIEYTGEYVNYLKKNVSRFDDSSVMFISNSGDGKEDSIAFATLYYIQVLYDYGKPEEAKKVCEDYVKSLPVEKLSSGVYLLSFCRQLTSGDTEADKAWAEDLIDYVLTPHNNNLDTLEKAFADDKNTTRITYNTSKWLYVNEEGYVITDKENVDL